MFVDWTSREKKLLIIICVLALLLFSLLVSSWLNKDHTQQTEFADQAFEQLKQDDPAPFDQLNERSNAEPEVSRIAEIETILVDIKGAVQQPYVYQMQADERVIDVIDRAGGLLTTASTVSINLAQKVFDGMVIYIPTEEEWQQSAEGLAPNFISVPSQATSQQQGGFSSGKININTANAAELESLPGIGPSRSKAIISYREENGLFTKPEDLMNVSGIGPKIFANLKDDIDVR